MKKSRSIQKLLVGAMILILMLSGLNVHPVFATTAQRNTAISAMSSMRNFVWYPNGSVKIYNRQYAVGGALKGLPYTQNADTTLQGFKTSPTMQYVPGGNFYSFSQPSRDVGNDCSSAVAIAWKAGGSSINVAQVYTGQMLQAVKSPVNKMAKRGNYSTAGHTYTDQMVAQYSGDAIKNLYSSLVPGDACVYRYKKNGSESGHAILITGVSTSTKTVTYIEQLGGNPATCNSTWRSGTKTFAQLHADKYVPLRPTDI